jgi:hypothetical protein
MNESVFLEKVISLAEENNVLWFHDYDSRRNPPGFPDLCLVGRRHVLFAELKNFGKLTSAQRIWRDRVTATDPGAWVIWTPYDLKTGEIEETLRWL